MKKIISLILTALTAMTVIACVAVPCAAGNEAFVYVTIVDGNGNLALTQKQVTVTDVDNDGKLTVNDALYCAHEQNYSGGASAGYASSQSSYGLSLDKLWGVQNGGAYGYYVNDAMAMSLADTVTNGDFINAFVYTDTTAWSDTYCFFSSSVASSVAGGKILLTLNCLGYDAQSSSFVNMPIEGATITVNGAATEYKTDANGSVYLKIDKAGTYVVSATSTSKNLVPPVLTLSVTAAAPETGDTELWILAAPALALTALLGAAFVYRRKHDEI